MASENHTSIGMCDLCGKEADARYEDCHVLFCTANCHREDGDIYHADCLKKFIGSGSKGTAKHLPSIPFSNFLCPKGKGRGPAKDDPVPCKGLAHHCKRVIVKTEPKAPPPQVLPEKRPKPQPKAANKQAAPRLPAKPAKPKGPPVTDNNPRARLPPMPEAPKADPLGRNLEGKGQQELPPGYVDEAEAAAERAKQGKAAKKNQKRAARRKEEGGPGWDASSANGSVSGTTTGLEEVQSQASLGWDNNNAAAGDTASVASAARFITNIDAYHALLARHMDLSDDSEYDYDSDDEATSHVAESAPVPKWSQQQQEDEPADQEGWQAVGVKGKAAPPAVSPQAGAASSSRVQEPGEDPAELQRREEELLRAAIQASMEEAGGQPAAASDEDDQLQRAMQESLALEEAQRRWEQEQQAALLAAAQARQQRQHSAESQPSAETSGGGGWPGVVMADSGDGWGSAGSADSAATAWGVSQGTPQQAPTHYQQQQPYASNPYAAGVAARAPAAAAAPAAPYLPYAAPTAAYAASATPTPLAATVSAPAVTTTAAAYQPAGIQQQQPPLPWLQPAAVSAPTAAMPAYPSTFTTSAVAYQSVSVAAAPAAEGQDDDDSLEDLLALLDV